MTDGEREARNSDEIENLRRGGREPKGKTKIKMKAREGDPRKKGSVMIQMKARKRRK